MRATLDWKSWCESPVLERVHRGQSVTFLNQFGKFFGCVFDLTRYFLSVNYEHRNRLLLGPELVVRIRKVANDLFFVGASGRPGPWIWPSEQRHVKAHSIGAIDDRSLFRKSGKSLLAVRALNEVSLQRSTPVAGAISAKTVPERGAKREKRWRNVKLRAPRNQVLRGAEHRLLHPSAMNKFMRCNVLRAAVTELCPRNEALKGA